MAPAVSHGGIDWPKLFIMLDRLEKGMAVLRRYADRNEQQPALLRRAA
jgi:hypothetical protein